MRRRCVWSEAAFRDRQISASRPASTRPASDALGWTFRCVGTTKGRVATARAPQKRRAPCTRTDPVPRPPSPSSSERKRSVPTVPPVWQLLCSRFEIDSSQSGEPRRRSPGALPVFPPTSTRARLSPRLSTSQKQAAPFDFQTLIDKLPSDEPRYFVLDWSATTADDRYVLYFPTMFAHTRLTLF